MNNKDLQDRIMLSSVRLRRLDNNNLPTGCGSACLITYTGKTLILTVAHNTGDFKNWAIEVKYIPSRRKTELYQIGAMNFLGKASLNLGTPFKSDLINANREDFSYAILNTPVTPLWVELNAAGHIINSVESVKLDTNLECVPDKNLEYGFYGQIKGELSGGKLKHEGRLEMGMKYLGLDDDFYLFQMKKTSPSEEDYHGCSGAPILNSNGELVSLVKSVWAESGKIRGIRLNQYKAAIDIECGNFS